MIPQQLLRWTRPTPENTRKKPLGKKFIWTTKSTLRWRKTKLKLNLCKGRWHNRLRLKKTYSILFQKMLNNTKRSRKPVKNWVPSLSRNKPRVSFWLITRKNRSNSNLKFHKLSKSQVRVAAFHLAHLQKTAPEGETSPWCIKTF